MKQFSNNPTLHIFNSGKICRVELCTELFYAIVPTLFICFFLICYPYISLHFKVFYSCISIHRPGKYTHKAAKQITFGA